MHFKISILSTNCFMAIYEILFNVDSIQALQCEIFSYVYELNLYSVYSWQIIILLELSRHPIELSIKLIVLSILFYSILVCSKNRSKDMRQFFNDSYWEVAGFAILKFFYYLPNFIFSAMLEVN